MSQQNLHVVGFLRFVLVVHSWDIATLCVHTLSHESEAFTDGFYGWKMNESICQRIIRSISRFISWKRVECWDFKVRKKKTVEHKPQIIHASKEWFLPFVWQWIKKEAEFGLLVNWGTLLTYAQQAADWSLTCCHLRHNNIHKLHTHTQQALS